MEDLAAGQRALKEMRNMVQKQVKQKVAAEEITASEAKSRNKKIKTMHTGLYNALNDENHVGHNAVKAMLSNRNAGTQTAEDAADDMVATFNMPSIRVDEDEMDAEDILTQP